jgi:hypothetical protein
LLVLLCCCAGIGIVGIVDTCVVVGDENDFDFMQVAYYWFVGLFVVSWFVLAKKRGSDLASLSIQSI